MKDLAMTGCILEEEMKGEKSRLDKYRPRTLLKLAYEGVCSRYIRPFLSKFRTGVSSSPPKTTGTPPDRDSKFEGISRLFEDIPVPGEASGFSIPDSESGIGAPCEDICINPEPNQTPAFYAEDELPDSVVDARLNGENQLGTTTTSNMIFQRVIAAGPQPPPEKAEAGIAAAVNTEEEFMFRCEKEKVLLAQVEQKRVRNPEEPEFESDKDPWEKIFTLETELTKWVFAWEDANNEVKMLRKNSATLRGIVDRLKSERITFEKELGSLKELLVEHGMEEFDLDYREGRVTTETASLHLEDIQFIRNHLLSLDRCNLEKTNLEEQLQRSRGEIISLEADNKLHNGRLTYANARINEVERENAELKEALERANEEKSRQLEEVQTRLDGLSRFSMLSTHTAEEMSAFLEVWEPIKSQLALSMARHRRHLLSIFSINHNEYTPSVDSVDNAIRVVQSDSISAELVLRLGDILVKTLERNEGLEWVLNYNFLSKAKSDPKGKAT